MTHDPLCPVSKWPADYPRCQCDLIADVIAAAVQRVESLTYVVGVGSIEGEWLNRLSVIAAIKGDQP